MVVVFLQHVYLKTNLTSIVSIVTGALKGVMRVGVLAKGLLLHERLDVNLVVLCHGEEKFFFHCQDNYRFILSTCDITGYFHRPSCRP